MKVQRFIFMELCKTVKRKKQKYEEHRFFLFFFSMSGKFLNIYKCHFGEGGRNNIKLYLFLYTVIKLVYLLGGYFQFELMATAVFIAGAPGLWLLLWKGLKGEISLQSFYHGQQRENSRLVWAWQRVVDACSSGS